MELFFTSSRRKKNLHPHCEESGTQNLIYASVDKLKHGLDYVKRL